LKAEDRATQESWTRSSTISAGQKERAEIVLAVADGAGVSAASRALGVSRPTVIKWRDRFAADGVAGLADQPRSGRPKTIDESRIIAATKDRCRPFVWTKTPDEILTKAIRRRTSEAGH
jgi:transposase